MNWSSSSIYDARRVKAGDWLVRVGEPFPQHRDPWKDRYSSLFRGPYPPPIIYERSPDPLRRNRALLWGHLDCRRESDYRCRSFELTREPFPPFAKRHPAMTQFVFNVAKVASHRLMISDAMLLKLDDGKQTYPTSVSTRLHSEREKGGDLTGTFKIQQRSHTRGILRHSKRFNISVAENLCCPGICWAKVPNTNAGYLWQTYLRKDLENVPSTKPAAGDLHDGWMCSHHYSWNHDRRYGGQSVRTESARPAPKSASARDSDTVLSLISPTYFEDMGTIDNRDDFGFEELKTDILAQNIDKIAELYLKIDVHDVQVKGDQAFIDIRYRTRAKLALPSGSTWTQDSDFSRVNFSKRMVAGWSLLGSK